jgi:hypothetical protein
MDVSVGVEGRSDEGAASAIVRACGLSVSGYYGGHGKVPLLRKLPNYNMAAMRSPWLVLVDLDDDGPCPGKKREDWLPDASPFMCFRIAVREIEAWLLADQERIAEFLGVPRSRIPLQPENLEDPKQTLVSIARRSRKRAIREGLVPRVGSGTLVGPTYASDIREFGRTQWRPLVAAESAPHLERCITRVRELASALENDDPTFLNTPKAVGATKANVSPSTDSGLKGP